MPIPQGAAGPDKAVIPPRSISFGLSAAPEAEVNKKAINTATTTNAPFDFKMHLFMIISFILLFYQRLMKKE